MSVMNPAGFRGSSALLGLLTLLSASAAMAQGRQLTAQDYAQAERFMPYDTQPLVDHDVRSVHWLDDRRFWYVDHDARRRSLPVDARSERPSQSRCSISRSSPPR